MTEILKYLISSACAALAFCFSRGYRAYLEERLALCAAFRDLLLHIRKKIECFLTPMEKLLDGYRNEALEKSGYLSAAVETDISKGFFELKERLGLPEEIKRLLSDFFEEFGRDWRAGTLKLIDSCLGELDEEIEKRRVETEKEIKVVTTVSVAAAAGLFIILI